MELIQQIFSMPIVQAVLWLIAAFIAAAIVKAIVKGIFNKTGLKAYMTAPERGTEEGFNKTVDYVSKLAYVITFLLFMPAIFSTLGAGDASQPLIQFLNELWGFVPNIVGAVIVLVTGLLIARLVRELLIPVFRKIKVDSLQEKAGIAVDDKSKLSETLAYIVYVLIVIPVIIVALQVLNISAISVPATEMLSTVINFIPYLVVGIIIVMVGVFVGRLAGNIVGQLVATTGVDAKLNEAYDGKLGKVNLSKVVNYVIQVIIIVLFTVQGLNVLNLDILTKIGTDVVSYLPNVLAAFIVFAIAAFCAGWAGKALRKTSFSAYALVAQVAIWVLAAFMVLTQLNIAGDLVHWSFVIIIAGVAVAFAIAFGVGGRDFAGKVLGYWGDDLDKAREEKLAAKDEPAPAPVEAEAVAETEPAAEAEAVAETTEEEK